MRRTHLSSKSLLLAAVALLLLLAAPLPAAEGKKQPTHYDVLELQQDATLKDIKKAYRKLAVQHHPDRNPDNVEAATSKFREIAEAYEVLSDEDARRDYDRALKGGFGGDGSGFKWTYGDATGGGGGRQRPRRRHRDAFATFNDAFQNDPFFADAFKSMDDLFDKHFSNSGGSGQRGRTQSSDATDVDNAGSGAGGWIWDKVKDYMPHVEVKTSSSSSFGGSTTYSSTSHSFGGGSSSRRSSSRSRSGGSGSRSSYTSRSTRTIMQNGQRVTIQTLEKDGNRIEEKYIGEELIERKINGLKEDIGRIGQDEF